MPLLLDLARFLPWCWGVNIALNILGYITRRTGLKDWPLDAGIRFADGRRVLGSSTTLLGLGLTVLFGVAGEAILSGHHLLVLALLVYVGHTLGSFVKRRLGKEDGAYVPLLDHGDYLLLIAAASFFTQYPPFLAVCVAYGITILVTPIVTILSYRLGIRKSPL